MRNAQVQAYGLLKTLMHEYPVTIAIIEIAERHARQHGADRVTGINLVVGENSGYLPECIDMYFDIIAGEGVCKGARLGFERIRPLLRCKKCGRHFPRRPFEFGCPVRDCGGEGEPTDIGREFYVKSIEIANAEEPGDRRFASRDIEI